MTNVWGFQSSPDLYVKCDRCAEYECICGDEAFEQFVLDELLAHAKEDGL